MNSENGQERVAPPQGLLRWLRFIPNSLTLGNSLCGYAAILITLQAYKNAGDQQAMATIFAWSAGLILFAMVLTSFWLVKRTRATLRIAELGFLGVVV